MKVFLSAGSSARSHALPNLITGFEVEVEPDVQSIEIAATLDSAADPPRLVGRPTGQTYRDLPWWTVEVDDDGQ